MRVLIDVTNSPPQKYFVQIFDKRLIRDVSGLVSSKRYSQAMIRVFTSGIFKRVIGKEEISEASIDLILSERSASWDVAT